MEEDIKNQIIERRKQALYQFYLVTMGQYELDDLNLKQKKQLSNKITNNCDGLKTICALFQHVVDELGLVDEKGLSDDNLEIELEMRIVCNVIINFLLYTNYDRSVG